VSITPNPDQFRELSEATDDGPVVMLNLLKFKVRAEDEEGSGRAAYGRYGDTALQMIEERGGRVLWAGKGEQVLIGDPDEDWDQIVLVEYPSRAAFLDMVSRPRYQEAHRHRESGLERTVLVVTKPLAGAPRES